MTIFRFYVLHNVRFNLVNYDVDTLIVLFNIRSYRHIKTKRQLVSNSIPIRATEYFKKYVYWKTKQYILQEIRIKLIFLINLFHYVTFNKYEIYIQRRGKVNILESNGTDHFINNVNINMCSYKRLLRTVSEIKIFEFTVAKLLMRKKH